MELKGSRGAGMVLAVVFLLFALSYGQGREAGEEDQGSCARCHTDRESLKASLSPAPERLAREEES